MLVGPLRVFLKTKVSEMYARAMNKLDKQVRTQSLITNSHSIVRLHIRRGVSSIDSCGRSYGTDVEGIDARTVVWVTIGL